MTAALSSLTSVTMPRPGTLVRLPVYQSRPRPLGFSFPRFTTDLELARSAPLFADNKVNQLIRERATDNEQRQPQIVGLTATPTWKDTVEKNHAALAELCKNMNDAQLIQVTDNLENLNQHVHEANERKHSLRRRQLDVQYKEALPDVVSHHGY